MGRKFDATWMETSLMLQKLIGQARKMQHQRNVTRQMLPIIQNVIGQARQMQHQRNITRQTANANPRVQNLKMKMMTILVATA